MNLKIALAAAALCTAFVTPSFAQLVPTPAEKIPAAGVAGGDKHGTASGGGAPLAGVSHHRAVRVHYSRSHCRYVINHPTHYRASTVRACHRML